MKTTGNITQRKVQTFSEDWNITRLVHRVCVRPSHLWLTTPTSCSSPSTSYEPLAEAAAFRTSLSSALWLTSSGVWTLRPRSAAEEQTPETNSTCQELTLQMPLPLFWLVINYVAFPALHHLESGVERSQLTRNQCVSQHSPSCCLQPRTCRLRRRDLNRPGRPPAQSPPRRRHLIHWWPTAAQCFQHSHLRMAPFAQRAPRMLSKPFCCMNNATERLTHAQL